MRVSAGAFAFLAFVVAAGCAFAPASHGLSRAGTQRGPLRVSVAVGAKKTSSKFKVVVCCSLTAAERMSAAHLFRDRMGLRLRRGWRKLREVCPVRFITESLNRCPLCASNPRAPQCLKMRLRREIMNEKGRLRLNVFRSNKHIYGQVQLRRPCARSCAPQCWSRASRIAPLPHAPFHDARAAWVAVLSSDNKRHRVPHRRRGLVAVDPSREGGQQGGRLGGWEGETVGHTVWGGYGSGDCSREGLPCRDGVDEAGSRRARPWLHGLAVSSTPCARVLTDPMRRMACCARFSTAQALGEACKAVGVDKVFFDRESTYDNK